MILDSFMAYVTSTNLCYHDNMHVKCSLFVDRFRRHLQYRLFQSPKHSTDYHLFLAAEKIAEIPARGPGLDVLYWATWGLIVGWGVNAPQ